MEEVIITAQHSAGSADQAVHQIRILDRARIDAQAAQSLPELLQTENGIQLTEDPATGTKLQIQGLAGQHVKILVDGVPVVGRLDGDIDLSQLPLHNIDHIEIIEGPLSVEYGSNAMGGVINLVTKTAAAERLTIKGTLLESTTGPGWSQYEGIHNLDGGLTWSNGRQEAGLQAGRYFFGGKIDEQEIRNKSWNPKRQSFVSGHYQWATDRGRIRLRSQVFDELLLRLGEPTGIYQIRALDEHVRSLRQMHQIDGAFQWKNDIRWQGFIAASLLDRTRDQLQTDLVSLEQTPLPGNTLEQFIGWSARGTFTKSWSQPGLSLQLGYDLLRETTTGDKILNEQQAQHDLAVFSSLEYRPVEALTIRPGIRMAHNDAYPAPATPSLNLKWTSSNSMTWRASWARGFRAPSLKELYLDFVDVNHNITGNSDLKAEYGQYWQGSGTWKKIVRNKLIRVNGSLFYNKVKDQIELAVVNTERNAFTYFNLETADLTGAKLDVSLSGEGWRMQVGSNLLLRKSPDGDWLPSFQANSSLQVTLPADISASLFYKFSGPAQTFQRSGEETVSFELARFEAYHWADVSLSRSFLDKRISLAAGVKNLLDVTNVAASGSTGGAHGGGSGQASISFGRTAFFRASFLLERTNK